LHRTAAAMASAQSPSASTQTSCHCPQRPRVEPNARCGKNAVLINTDHRFRSLFYYFQQSKFGCGQLPAQAWLPQVRSNCFKKIVREPAMNMQHRAAIAAPRAQRPTRPQQRAWRAHANHSPGCQAHATARVHAHRAARGHGHHRDFCELRDSLLPRPDRQRLRIQRRQRLYLGHPLCARRGHAAREERHDLQKRQPDGGTPKCFRRRPRP
jgi:hypothetical protein